MTKNTHAKYLYALLLAWRDISEEDTILPALRELGSMLAEIKGNPKDISTSVVWNSIMSSSANGLRVYDTAGVSKKVYSFEADEEELEQIRETDEYKRAREVVLARHT